jgi:hypothetical protein
MSFEIKPAVNVYDLDDSITQLQASVTSLTPTTILSLIGPEILALDTTTITVDNLDINPNVRNNLHIYIRGIVGTYSNDAVFVKFYDENNAPFEFIMAVRFSNGDAFSGNRDSLLVQVTTNNQSLASINKGILDIKILDIKDLTKFKTFTGSLIQYNLDELYGNPTLLCHGIENHYVSGTSTLKSTLSKLKKIEIVMDSNSVLRSQPSSNGAGFIKITSD